MDEIDRPALDKLFWDLRTRVLSLEEMQAVEDAGLNLVTRNGVPYFEAEKLAELNAALLQQFKMRLLAEESELRRKRELEKPASE